MNYNGDFEGGVVISGDKTTISGKTAIALNGSNFDDHIVNNPNINLFGGGGIMTEDVKVKPQSAWADYKLLSLDATAQYIAKNKHLPNIPSADEVAEQGYSISEMSKLQMEKIEELTLHLIQVKQEKDELEKRLEKIEALLLQE